MQTVFETLEQTGRAGNLRRDPSGIYFTMYGSDFQIVENGGQMLAYMDDNLICGSNNPQHILDAILLPF